MSPKQFCNNERKERGMVPINWLISNIKVNLKYRRIDKEVLSREFQIPDLFSNMLCYIMDPDHDRKTKSKFGVVFPKNRFPTTIGLW